MFHRIEPRIFTHVLLCRLALLLIPGRRMPHRADLAADRIEVVRLHGITLSGPTVCVELDGDQIVVTHLLVGA